MSWTCLFVFFFAQCQKNIWYLRKSLQLSECSRICLLPQCFQSFSFSWWWFRHINCVLLSFHSTFFVVAVSNLFKRRESLLWSLNWFVWDGIFSPVWMSLPHLQVLGLSIWLVADCLRGNIVSRLFSATVGEGGPVMTGRRAIWFKNTWPAWSLNILRNHQGVGASKWKRIPFFFALILSSFSRKVWFSHECTVQV